MLIRYTVALTAAAAMPACSAELALKVQLPRIDIAEYHRPYLAAWLEKASDQSYAGNVALWYDLRKRDNGGAKWLKDMRSWWRKSGHDTAMVDGNGETRRWRGAAAALASAVPPDAQELQVSRQLQRVETFVTHDTPSALPATLAGDGLELLPLTPPTDLSVGDTSRFRLFLDGKPDAGADVTVIRGGNRYRYRMGEIALKTDAAGEFALAWPEAGRYWLGVSHGARPPGAADAAPAALPRRESYSATFDVLPK